MKRSLFFRAAKKSALAVPAAALMLGAAHAGTTVGLNFQAWYYDSGTNPQTVGFGSGYQTTGFPVTAYAFGLSLAEWTSTDPLDCQSAISEAISFGGTLVAQVTAPNAWQSGIGETVAGWNPEVVAPGNNEVTWGYLDDGNATGSSPSVTVSNLAAKFPSGYVIQTIAANSGIKLYNNVDFTDGVTTNTVAYSTYVVVNPVNDGYSQNGTVGLSAQSAALTSDTIIIHCQPKTAGFRSTLAGFIITDKPVVSQSPTNLTVNQGSPLSLNAGVIGLNAISYQWKHAGTNFPGATTVPFSKTAAPADAGDWVLSATNSYGATTSLVATVTVNQVPLIITDLPATTNLVYAGFGTVLSVIAGGAEPLSYQWKSNGTTVLGATNSSFIPNNATAGLVGYSVVVTNSYGSAKSSTNSFNVVAAPDSYTTQVAKDAPASYWPLNETSGFTALDYSGYSHDGAQSNGVSIGVSGPQPPSFPGFSAGKTAYQFDGAGSFVDCGTGPALAGTTDFSLEAWVNTTSTTAARFLQQRSSTGFNGEYMLDINADGTVGFTVYGGGYQFAFSTAIAVNDGNWHQVVAVRSGTNGFIYIDGALGAQAVGPLAALDPTLTVGFGKDIRDNNSFYSGKLADVAIYKQALSASRVISHYLTASGAAFVLQLKPGGLAQDSKPVGTLHPGPNYRTTWIASSTDTAVVPVTRTGVEQFTASSSSQIVIPPSPDFDSVTGTIIFWMNAGAPIPGPGAEAAMLMDHRTTNGTVITLNDAGALFVQCSQGANSLAVGYLPDNNWHQVAVTYDQSLTGSLEIFIDGVSAGSQLNTTNWAWPTSQELELGISHDPYWKRYNGLMDDFRIYSRILTPAEISSAYSTGALVDTSALKVRYNFDTAAGVGETVSWPFGTLLSSPTLGPSAIWAPVTGAAPPSYPFPPAGTSRFFRAQY